MGRGFVVGVLVGSAFLVSCGSSGAVGLDQARLGDAVLAVRLSPQVREIVTEGQRGHLVLAGEKGGSRVFDVGGMDLDRVVWGKNGIYFSDTWNEYRVDSGGVKTFRRNTDAYGLDGGRFLVKGGTESVGLYNIGSRPEGYLFKVASVGDEDVEVWESSGLTLLTSQCGDKVFGVAKRESTRPVGDSGSGVGVGQGGYQDRQVLIQMYPEPKGIPGGIVGEVTLSGDYDQGATGVACSDGVMYFLAEKFASPLDPSNAGRSVLRKWNTETGEYSEVALVGEKGEDFRLSTAWPPDDVPSPTPNTSRLSVDGRKLLWVSQKGLFHETDLTTGVTRCRFRVKQDEVDIEYSVLHLTANGLIMLEARGVFPSFAFDLAVYDLENGDRRVLLTVDDMPKVRSEDIVRSIAINPEWLKSKGLG